MRDVERDECGGECGGRRRRVGRGRGRRCRVGVANERQRRGKGRSNEPNATNLLDSRVTSGASVEQIRLVCLEPLAQIPSHVSPLLGSASNFGRSCHPRHPRHNRSQSDPPRPDTTYFFSSFLAHLLSSPRSAFGHRPRMSLRQAASLASTSSNAPHRALPSLRASSLAPAPGHATICLRYLTQSSDSRPDLDSTPSALAQRPQRSLRPSRSSNNHLMFASCPNRQSITLKS